MYIVSVGWDGPAVASGSWLCVAVFSALVCLHVLCQTLCFYACCYVCFCFPNGASVFVGWCGVLPHDHFCLVPLLCYESRLVITGCVCAGYFVFLVVVAALVWTVASRCATHNPGGGGRLSRCASLLLMACLYALVVEPSLFGLTGF